jgi:hypothetical protein
MNVKTAIMLTVSKNQITQKKRLKNYKYGYVLIALNVKVVIAKKLDTIKLLMAKCQIMIFLFALNATKLKVCISIMLKKYSIIIRISFL